MRNFVRICVGLAIVLSSLSCRPLSPQAGPTKEQKQKQTIEDQEVSVPESEAELQTLGQTIERSNKLWTAVMPRGSFTASATTADRPQSKVWQHDQKFWTIMPKSDGTFVYLLEDNTWKPVLKVSNRSVVYADVAVSGNLVHAILFGSNVSYMVHLEYSPTAPSGYKMWSKNAIERSVFLDRGIETATIAKDSNNRLWIASDIASVIVVRSSVSPYTTWSAPFVVASGVGATDISGIVSLPNNSIGVFWSNQVQKRFGFRVHRDIDPVGKWQVAEVPASEDAQNIGQGMADAQFHLTTTIDGTVLAAVKTKYATFPNTQIGLLVRRPTGVWDPKLYKVDAKGINPVVSYANDTGSIRVLYGISKTGSNILMSESPLSEIAFTPPRTVFQGLWTNVSVSKYATANDAIAIASQGNSIGSIKMTSYVGDNTPVFVDTVVDETAEATTARLQEAINSAASRQVGVHLRRGAKFDITRSLNVVEPGPLYISGANAIINKVQGEEPAIILESVQDGFTLEDLKILGAATGHVDNLQTCAVEWPQMFATNGVILNRGRWTNFRNISVRNVSQAAILLESKTGEISDVSFDRVQVKDAGEGIKILGSATNPIKKVEFFATAVHLVKDRAFSSAFATDVMWRSGALEKTLGDMIHVADSQRVTFYSYAENYGGWIYTSSNPAMVWCPRNAQSVMVRLDRSSDFFYRGRIGPEADRGNAGPLLAQTQSNCYAIANKGKTLATSACATATTPIAKPTKIVTEYLTEYQHPNNQTEIEVLPTDAILDVKNKFKEAAQKRLGVRLVNNGVYNWPMITMAGNADTPAYIDGRNATINLMQDPTIAAPEGAIKVINPTNWVGRDRFAIKDLSINVGKLANSGIWMAGGMFVYIRNIRVTNANGAAVHAEGKPGAGLYYNAFSNITVDGSGAGVDIISTINSKYANANGINGLNTTKTPLTFALHWTSSTVGFGIKSDFTGLATGVVPYLVDTSYSSDIEIDGVTTVGAPLSDALLKKGNMVEGIYYAP